MTRVVLYKQVHSPASRALYVLVVFACACSPDFVGRGSRQWRSPASSTPIDVPPPLPPTFPNAVLTMSKVTVTRRPPAAPGEPFYFEARFELKETGGKSGATIMGIATSIANGEVETTGPDCWREVVRVPPGGTLSYFDAGWESLWYCAPFAASRADAEAFNVVVTFVDDDGRRGTLGVTGPVTK